MVFKGLVAAATAVALSAAPTVAAAQMITPTQLAPADESVDGSELRGGFIIPGLAIILIIIAIVIIVEDEDDLPTSP